MPMLMMHVGQVRMDMPERVMLMPVGVRFARRIVRSVHMLMMFVMSVRVGMSYWLMEVLVLVVLSEVKPNTQTHQSACGDELHSDWLSKSEHGCGRATKGRG